MLGGRRHVGSPLQCAKAHWRPVRGPSSRQHKSAGTRGPIYGRAKSADLEPLPTAHWRELLRPSRVPGGGSEEMLTGLQSYQAWPEAILSCVPNGIRTRAAALKGRSPRPLDDGDVG